MNNWDYESISLTNKQQSLMMYVFEMFIKFPYLLEDFNLHRKQIKDINGRYVTQSILHNEEISNIYTTLKDQITENVRKEYLLKEVYNLSEEDKQKLITLANQIKEAKKQWAPNNHSFQLLKRI